MKTLRKNIAGQVVGVSMISTAGATFTGSVTVYVTKDGGTQALGSVGSGACTHEGNGYHTYAPSQDETNADHVGFTFTGASAIPTSECYYPQATYLEANIELVNDVEVVGDGAGSPWAAA